MSATLAQIQRAFPDLDEGLVECIHSEEAGNVNACYEQLTGLGGEPAISKAKLLAEIQRDSATGEADLKRPKHEDPTSPVTREDTSESGMSRQNTTASEAVGEDMYDAALPQTVDEMRSLRQKGELNELMFQKLKDIDKQMAEDKKFEQIAASQKKLGPQSLRHNPGINIKVGGWNQKMFESMIQRETDHCGEFLVFYHSYNFSELLYEVQSTLARVAYGLKPDFAPLPRCLKEPFGGKPHIQVLLDDFKKMANQDANAAFQEVAISTSVSLQAPSSAAPPMQYFQDGYSCFQVDFRGLLCRILKTLGCPEREVDSLADRLSAVGLKYGLCDAYSRNKGAINGSQSRAGHMLQIFVRVDCIDDVAYGSHSLGIYDDAHNPLSVYLLKDQAPDGQGRVFWHPALFMDETKVKLYHYPAREEFFKSRLAFLKDLEDTLRPVMFDTPQKMLRLFYGFEGKVKEMM